MFVKHLVPLFIAALMVLVFQASPFAPAHEEQIQGDAPPLAGRAMPALPWTAVRAAMLSRQRDVADAGVEGRRNP